MNWIREYWNDIQSGKTLVNELVRLQMEIIIDDLENPKSITYENDLGELVTCNYVFDEERGEYIIGFIEQFCKHSKAPWTGSPVILEVWQKARIQAAYGFIDANTGLRQYTEVLTIVARKNGKTTEAAAIGLYSMIADGEGGAEIYSVATKKDIARKSFGEACNMVSQSDLLRGIITKRKSDLYCESTFSEFKPLASDADTLDGLNGSLVLADEIHAWKTRDLYDVLVQSFGSRQQPMMWIISTLGFIRESICDSKMDYAEKCLTGVYPRDYNKLYFIYKLDSREEWTEHKMWVKANPAIGTIKKFKYLQDRVAEALKDPMLLPTVLTKDFNVIDTIAGSWLSYDVILNKTKFEMDFVKNTYAIGGCDLSATTDLTCATLILMKPDSENVYLLQQYFIPEMTMKKKIQEDSVPYDIWEKQGWVTRCDGSKVKYSDVTAWFKTMRDQHGIFPVWIGYDAWQANYWVDEMESEGFTMEVVRQGYQTMSGPMKLMEADLMSKNLIYNDNPIFKWCLTNVVAKTDENGNIRPVKNDTQTLRIDGVVSAIDAYVMLGKHKTDYMTLI